MAEPSRVVHQAQAERWNGPSGRHWIAHRERHTRGHEPLTTRLFDAALISADECVLDVGCGCGETTIAAARAARDGSALGIDVSGPMLDVARQLAAEERVTNVRFERGDAQVYPLRQDSYDVVISSFGVMFFADTQAAFGNIVSGLRRGGRMAFLCWQDDACNEQFAIPQRAIAAHTQAPGLAADDLFADRRRVTEMLITAGCSEVQVEDVRDRMWLGSDADDVVGYVGSMPRLRTQLEELDNGPAEEVLHSMAAEFAARQGADGVWAACAAWLVTARRPAQARPGFAALTIAEDFSVTQSAVTENSLNCVADQLPRKASVSIPGMPVA